jgi:predicted phage-related endonuclease
MTYNPPTKSPEWHARRRASLGGSDANILVNGTVEEIHQLWEIKTGVKDPEDLSDVFPVQLGTVTEDFNIWWFGKKTGLALSDHQKGFSAGFRSCTVDAMATLPDGTGAVVEAKHTSDRWSVREVIDRYQPQLHHNMVVTGVKKAFLSIIRSNTWDYAEVEYNEEYAKKLMAVEDDFWECVVLKMPPGGVGAPKLVAPDPHRIIDMTGNNAWADAAADWVSAKIIAKKFDAAASTLKAMVAEDVKEARGHGICASRNKRGAISIKEV